MDSNVAKLVFQNSEIDSNDINIILEEASKKSADTPILLMHGNQDDIIPIKAGKTAYNILRGRGYPIYFESYKAKHKIPLKKMNLINEFINQPINVVKAGI